MSDLQQKEIAEFKEFIYSKLFNHEKKILDEGLSLLEYSFDDIIHSVINGIGGIQIVNDQLSFDVINLPQNSLVQKIEARVDNFSEEQLTKLRDFVNIFFRFRFILTEFLLDNGHFDAALSFNEFLLSSTDKMQKRLDVDLSEDEILKKYILEINRDIKEINIKIAKQIEQTAISREYIILAEHQNINPKIKWIESREKLLETIRKEQCITRKPSHSIESLAFSCFYIEGDETDSDIKLSFKDVERIVLAFFIQLINAKCIDYDDLSPELLRKISLYCLNRFGNSFKVPQLQTVIAKYSMIPNIKD